MDKFIIGFFCVIFVALITDVHGGEGTELLKKPKRPAIFHNLKEKVAYVKKLIRWHYLVSRPR